MTVHLVQFGEQAGRIKSQEHDQKEVLNSSLNRPEGVRCSYRSFKLLSVMNSGGWPGVVCTSCNTTVQEEAATHVFWQ